ncbi:MAG: hypothetical protein DMG93_13060 [Acidobacteria bacterium]|nr:MAG: hypothetical protein DMG93_13060 [Acidobacteriota bacterium]
MPKTISDKIRRVKLPKLEEQARACRRPEPQDAGRKIFRSSRRGRDRESGEGLAAGVQDACRVQACWPVW